MSLDNDIIAQHPSDGAYLIRVPYHAYGIHCSACGEIIPEGAYAWSYLPRPTDGNYVEHGHCRYGLEEHSRLLQQPYALTWNREYHL